MAEQARRLGRLRISHRDYGDFWLTAADREEAREESLVTASRLLAALSRSEDGRRAATAAVTEVYPWSRHLPAAERAAFTADLTGALSGAAGLDGDFALREVIAGWRGTARIKADKLLYAQALTPSEGDFGPVEIR